MASIAAVQWAQRLSHIIVTVICPAEPIDVHCDLTGDSFCATITTSGAEGGHLIVRSPKIEFFDSIDAEQSGFVIVGRTVRVKLQKHARSPFWPRLTKATAKNPHLTIDWSLWKDEEDLTAAAEDQEMKKMFAQGLQSPFSTQEGVTITGGGDPLAVQRLQQQLMGRAVADTSKPSID